MNLPALDTTTCQSWSEIDRDLYAKLPYYFYKATAAFRQSWETWPKLLEKIPWTANQGSTMKLVGVEPQPVLRQMAFPKLLSETPQLDVVFVRERTTEAKLRIKQFMTPHFNFLPAFQDFMRGNIQPHRENLDRQIIIYEEQFYRTHIFHWSPFVYLAGYGLVAAPSAEGSSDGSTGKSNAWLQSEALNKVTQPLTFKELFKAQNQFEEEVGATPYEGSGQPGGESGPLNEKFGLVTNAQTWNNFVDDPWLKENRPLNMNIVTEAFRGEFFGKIKTKIERYGIRILADNNFSPTFPAPETVEADSSHPEYNRTYPNPDYARNSQFHVSFLLGGKNYQYIDVGPVPSPFGEKDVNGIMGMDWNGKIQLTKNFAVPCIDSNGSQVFDFNTFGHYIRMQAEAAMGIVGFNKFNILPIIHLAKTGLTV